MYIIIIIIIIIGAYKSGSVIRSYLCSWNCRGDLCNTHLLGGSANERGSVIVVLLALIFFQIQR